MHCRWCLPSSSLCRAQQTKPAGSVYVDRHIPNHQLTRIIAEQGVLYPFLLQTHREEREGKQSVRHVVAGTAPSVSPASPSQAAYAATSNSNAFTIALQQQQRQQQLHNSQPSNAALTGSQIMRDSSDRDLHQRTHVRSPSQAHFQQQQQNGVSPPRQLAPLAARPSTPVLHLDRPTSRMLMPGNQQEKCGAVMTTGCDPHVKYRTPLLTSHRVGWNVQNTTLEFFGVGKHAKHELSTRRLYGWD